MSLVDKWALCSAALCCGTAFAQTPKPAGYPAKPVRVVVGFAAGGGTGIIGRIVAQKLAEASGSSFIVENRPGASATIAARLFKQMAGVDLLYVPYKGEAPAISDMIGGQISMGFGNVISVIAHVKSGRLRCVAVTSLQRIATLNEFPTMAESGLPEFVVESWNGLVGPAGMPVEIVAKLNADLVRTLNQPDVKSKLLDQGLFVQSGSPDAPAALLRNELAKWAKLIRTAGTKLD